MEGQLQTQGENCGYCGAPLDPRFYFCLSCATPYTHADSVLPRMPPPRLTDGMRIAARAPMVAPLFWTYLSVLVGTYVLSWILFAEDRPDLHLFLADGAILVTTCVFAVLYWPSLKPQLKRIGFDHVAAWLGLSLLVPALWINGVYHSWLGEEMGVPVDDLVTRLHELGLGREAMIFLFCLAPAVTEEIAFRGLVQHWLERAIRPMNAIILASALFTALHFTILSFPYIFALGALLGAVKWKTQSLYPSIVMHFVHNLFVIEVLWA